MKGDKSKNQNVTWAKLENKSHRSNSDSDQDYTVTGNSAVKTDNIKGEGL